MRTQLQHYLNPLHVFCRLRNMGLSKTPALYICLFYERAVFNIFISRLGKLNISVGKKRSTESISNGSWLK